MLELGPNRIEDPVFVVLLLLQGIHGHAGKVDGLLNLPGSKEDAQCYRGGSERDIHLVRDTANVDCAGPSTDMSHPGRRKCTRFKRRLFCPWP